ncbi:MAG TPA: TadE/TadG family type IV pilus assembly protein [Acidimicrobiia bacterium]|jgi:Flp pilus assembly pilin Flp|nr:TadE/TadG family type IV pilus assembly protein [Acidimicrobiia bacterium]
MATGNKDDRGATLVEAALVYALLFLALFAVVEFGLAFKDWLSVSHAAREGARAGATYGDDPTADIQILRDVERTLAPAGIAENINVRVFDAASPGTGEDYTYTPGSDCSDNTPVGLPALVGCCDWTPCPEPFRDSYSVPGWDPSTRDVEAPDLDRIAVEVAFTHQWLTNYFVPSSDFTTVTDFQIEPQVFES